MVDIEIKRLRSEHLDPLKRLFVTITTTNLSRTFHPHSFDDETAVYISSYAGIDWYAGVFINNLPGDKIIGYAMLRGWDEGYNVPSLGICVVPPYQNSGFGNLLLRTAILMAKYRRSPAIRLKVYPENKLALELYTKAGFTFTGEIQQNQLVGIKEL